MKRSRNSAVIAAGALVALTAAACSGGGTTTTASSTTSSAASKGGTLYYLTFKGSAKWDPQAIYIGAHIEFANRMFARTLVTYPVGATGDAANKLVPDMATDTGKSTDNNKTWAFTLKDGIKWEDGKAVTCADVKYGVSKSFDAAYVVGPQYAKQFLDIPDGGYTGPYTKKGQALYDKAVTCAGNTITFKLKKSVVDFNYAVAMTAFAAARQDMDKGAKGWLNIFSDGPYKLQGGVWDSSKGGTFVRNTNWDPATDTIRKAYPNQVVWQQGIQTETILQRMIADGGNDQTAVTDRTAPASFQSRIVSNPAVKKRSVNPDAPYVDYLALNMRRLTNEKVREAIAVATDRTAYIAAAGGPQEGSPATGVISPSVKGYKKFDGFDAAPPAGDAAKAKALLTAAGVPMPYPLVVAYPQTPTADNQFGGLKAAWEKAGFSVKLLAQPDTDYYSNVQTTSTSKGYDVMWASWGADWPAASTVIPPLFDSRINFASDGSSTGSDYGFYDDKTTNTMMDAAYAAKTVDEAATMWGNIDERIVATQHAAVPLQTQKFLFVYGSKIKNFSLQNGLGGYVDMANIAVQ